MVNSLRRCCHYEWESKGNNVVKDKATKHVYGVSNKYDDDKVIQKKLFTISYTQPFVNIVRMASRVWKIIRGDCFRVGYKEALKDWKIQTQAWSLNKNKISAPPSNLGFVINVGKHSFIELVKMVGKLATYPLATIGMVFAALYGKCHDPKAGRAMYATIERTWASNWIEMTGKYAPLKLQIGDYLAACMQPQEVWDTHNLYKIFLSGYNPKTIRSLIVKLKVTLEENKEFFEKELKDEKVTMILAQVEKYRDNISKVSKKDIQEMDKHGNFYEEKAKEVAALLGNILLSLEKIEQARAREFLQQCASAGQMKDQPSENQKEIDQKCEAILTNIKQLNDKFEVKEFVPEKK